MQTSRRRILAAACGVTYPVLAGCSTPFSSQPNGEQPATNTTQEPPETTPTPDDVEYALDHVSHTPLSTPGEYTEGSISYDGQFGVIGSTNGHGTTLINLESPADPSVLHQFESTAGWDNRDVKFDPRGGLYYRTREPDDDHGEDHDSDGNSTQLTVEIIDFGFGNATPTNPQLIGEIPTDPAHNIHPHPDAPIVYGAIPGPSDGNGLRVWDVSDPANPETLHRTWDEGGLHDIVADGNRDLLHCASSDGYMIFDIAEPGSPNLQGWFDYSDHPEYTEIGTPGYESGHYADFDPTRKLAVVGDELTSGVPGGKHVFDIGWDTGSPDNPEPLGFTHSPNARPIDDSDDTLWTTHNHDVIPLDSQTLLVSGDYSEGVVLYDITDPRNPTPVDTYPTRDGADDNPEGGRAPWAWSAVYHPTREFIFASDKITGCYTFELTTT